jgi:hypothetical protein
MTVTEPVIQSNDSFLIAECGHTNTTAVLFDVVEGSYRLVARGSAPSTVDAPWYDMSIGVQHAITEIASATGRPLLEANGALIMPTREEDGAGVDYFALLVSCGDPLKVVVAGLLDDVSLASARRALATIFAQEVDSFSLADTRSTQEQLSAIWHHQPQLIFVVGGTDGGATDRLRQLLKTLRLGIGLPEDKPRPDLLYAGNSALRETFNEALGELTELHVADNVRPDLETENLLDAARQLGDLYERHQIAGLPGVAELYHWSSFPVQTTPRALALVMQYLAALYQGHLLAVDLGSDTATFISARPESTQLAVHSHLGLGRPLQQLLDTLDADAILEWIPHPLTTDTLADFMVMKALRPGSLPFTEEDLYLEQAIARQIIRYGFEQSARRWEWSQRTHPPPFKMLVLRGAVFTQAPKPVQSLLMALDALQPVGIFSVVLDKYGVLPALGAIAPQVPLVTVQSLEAGALAELGWVVAPVGRARPGQPVMQVLMQPRSGGSIQMEVEYGAIELLPLAPGQEAQVRLQPARRFDIGYGPGKGRTLTIQGGAVGLVIDARGRPIQLPPEDEPRRELLRRWLWDLGG